MNVRTVVTNFDDGSRPAFSIVVDDKELLQVNSLCRSDCYGIVSMMRKAYEAGKAGEPFTCTEEGE